MVALENEYILSVSSPAIFLSFKSLITQHKIPLRTVSVCRYLVSDFIEKGK